MGIEMAENKFFWKIWEDWGKNVRAVFELSAADERDVDVEK